MAKAKSVANATPMVYDAKAPTPARSRLPCQAKLRQYSMKQVALIWDAVAPKLGLLVLRLSIQ